MKILIIGSGVIGSIYGYYLSKAGNRVEHYVRKEKEDSLKHGVKLCIKDGRKAKLSKEIDEKYYLKTVTELSDSDHELVIVSVNCYQLEGLLEKIAGKLPNAYFLIFCNFWGKRDAIEKHLPRERYIMGFPNAGGGQYKKEAEPTIKGGIIDSVTIGGDALGLVEKVASLYEKAGLKTNIDKNILHWLWVHYAINSGLSSACVHAGGSKKFLSSLKNIRLGVINVKEALQVCEARGVKLKDFPEARLFLMPTTAISIGLLLNMKFNKSAAEILLEYKGVEEMKIIYNTIIFDAKKYNVNLSNMSKLENEIKNADLILSK